MCHGMILFDYALIRSPLDLLLSFGQEISHYWLSRILGSKYTISFSVSERQARVVDYRLFSRITGESGRNFCQ